MIGKGRASARHKPSRQLPHRTIRAGLCEYQLRSDAVEGSGAARGEADRRKTVAREVESVVGVSFWRREMRMSAGPRDFRGEVIVCARYSIDLEPAEDDVKFRRIADESEHACDLLSAPKASEEKEEIAAFYFVARQMALCGSSLAENRTPSGSSCNRVPAQIRIEMRAVASTDSAARQVFYNFRDWRAAERRNFLV